MFTKPLPLAALSLLSFALVASSWPWRSLAVDLRAATGLASQINYLPFISQNFNPANASNEWSQYGHDAQHTSFTSVAVPAPWRWKWVWNGLTSAGGVSAGKFQLPRNSQPVTGGGLVFIAAGAQGVYALNQSNGAVAWSLNPGGSLNSTPAYDADTGALFVLSSNGTLYKLAAATGASLGQFATGSTSPLPLPPAVLADRLLFAMGNQVYALNKQTLAQLWAYNAGAAVHTPPAYSPSRNRVIVVTSDLFVHAIDNASGQRAWRVKPTGRSGGDPGAATKTLAEAQNGWPVIAEGHGYVLVQYRLDWEALWTWSPWPGDNATMRANLQAHPEYQTLFVLSLDNGAVPFIANVGHGGFGDGGFLPMGPQPVIKRFSNGQEVAYVVMRGSPCLKAPCDGRGDAHLGELLLDDTTVPGYQAGYVRFIQNTYFPTDEEPFLSMAGDQLLAAHWEAGIAHQILDRSASRGTGANPITTSLLPHLVISQDQDVCNRGYSSGHYCSQGLVNTRTWPAGFYIYWKAGAVFDQYWSGYASWVESNGLVLFVGVEGSVAALEAGTPSAAAVPEAPAAAPTAAPTATARPLLPRGAVQAVAIPQAGAMEAQIIPFETAALYAGQTVTVEGVLQYIFNNRKAVYLGFRNPHQGVFIVRIMKEAWGQFAASPETLYSIDQRVRVTGFIEWYQGDPVMYVVSPAQIQIMNK